MKNKIRFILVILLFIIGIGFVMVLLPVKEKYITLELSFDKDDYVLNDEVIVEAVLRNSSPNFSKVTFLHSEVHIFIFEDGENRPAIPSLAVIGYIMPYGKIKETARFVIDDESKDYFVMGYSQFKVKDKTYTIETIYMITSGKVIRYN